MGYKHRALPHNAALASLAVPNYLLKIIPHVDGSARICELVRYFCEDITVKGSWAGPARLHLVPHVNAPLADLPVRRAAQPNKPVRQFKLVGRCASQWRALGGERY